MASLIKVENMDFVYPDGTPALFDINLSVGEGEFMALIGQNGSGKTTLSKCLNGLLKPTRGQIWVGDLDTREKRIIKKLLTRLGYVVQNPYHLHFNNTMANEIAYCPQNIGLSIYWIEVQIKEAARVAGVDESHFDTHPYFLPKGLRQRVAIASILALKPRTIIVDEPTTGQDMVQSREVMNFLKRLRDEEGHSIIIITHEMPIVAQYAERTVVLGQGRVLLDGPTRDVFSQPEVLKHTYVEPPQITRLGQALAEYGVPRNILTVDEMKQYLNGRGPG